MSHDTGNKQKLSSLSRIAPYLVLAVMLALSVWFWRFLASAEKTKARARFDRYCNGISHDIAERLNAYKMILQGGAGLFISSQEEEREEWRRYVKYRHVQTLYPDIQALGFAKVIPAAELAHHVESVRAEGFPEYSVRPEGKRAIYTPIVFLEPLDVRNRRALGYDLSSEPVLRTAMERARDTDMPAMSASVKLVQETGEEVQAGYVIFVPMYAGRMASGNVEERRAALKGYVYAAFRIKDLLRGIFPEAPREVAFQLYDGDKALPEALVFESRDLKGGSDNGHRPRFSAQKSLELYGHTWTLAFHSTPYFEAMEAAHLPRIVLATGLAISILFFLLMRSQQNVLIKAKALADDLSKELRESEQRLIYLITMSPAVIYTLDPADFSLKWVSPNVSDILGYTEKEVLEPGWWEGRLHPEDREQALAASSAVFATGRTVHEYRFQRKDGTFIWVLDELRVIRDDQGQPVELVGSWRDITARKQAEADRIARQAAEEANRAKSVFLANMSHEIRTPLNAILGFAQILDRDASLAPRQKEMVHTIQRSGRHLLNLINDVLDMSKIEAGRLELNPTDFCLHDLLDDVEMMFRSRAQAKGLQLLMERADGLPRYINADEAKLRQVLVNLVGNAVKFTKAGGVAVRVRADAEPDDENASRLRLVVEVEDSGPGIAEEDLERIFEPFQQSAAGRDAGGTGLGLAVSRRLVELMGGSLTVQSELGKGSCFRFDVLVTPVEGPEKEEALKTRQVVGLEPGTGPFRILVVDDQKDNRDLLVALLEPLGFEIREAANGQEALELFEAWSPHAVLMDMRMPVMDGYEATRRIKATEQGRATPVIAVTATGFTDAMEKVMATGVDGYIRKPFRPEEIFAVLGKCLGLRYVYADDTGQVPEEADIRPLTREDLAALPEALRQDMRLAVDTGDMVKLRALIAQVEATDARTARKLKNLADQYDYETLSRILEKK
ncbi:MAG: CHASE domain-containing protein [Geoalkalibacter sp.]|uniref:CHASE domain-containing protein n=1 Tax=Geoalkalibacter sp. TaxID=3041440 RepID=UPI003D122442